jgi:hypothetical protein
MEVVRPAVLKNLRRFGPSAALALVLLVACSGGSAPPVPVPTASPSVTADAAPSLVIVPSKGRTEFAVAQGASNNGDVRKPGLTYKCDENKYVPVELALNTKVEYNGAFVEVKANTDSGTQKSVDVKISGAEGSFVPYGVIAHIIGNEAGVKGPPFYDDQAANIAKDSPGFFRLQTDQFAPFGAHIGNLTFCVGGL